MKDLNKSLMFSLHNPKHLLISILTTPKSMKIALNPFQTIALSIDWRFDVMGWTNKSM